MFVGNVYFKLVVLWLLVRGDEPPPRRTEPTLLTRDGVSKKSPSLNAVISIKVQTLWDQSQLLMIIKLLSICDRLRDELSVNMLHGLWEGCCGGGRDNRRSIILGLFLFFIIKLNFHHCHRSKLSVKVKITCRIGLFGQ